MYIMMACKIYTNNENIISNVDQYNNHLPLIDDPNLWKLIHQYQKVFCDSLLNNLAPKRDVKYTIEIDSKNPININIYLLFKT